MNAESMIALLGVGGGVVAFWVGLWQYRSAQRWKVLEFVAQEIKEFEKLPAVSNAMLMLDYENVPIVFPEHEGSMMSRVTVDEQMLVSSLSVDPGKGFAEPELAIRDTFDDFFGCLERFDQYVESGLVPYEAFHPYLKYWLGILARGSGLKSELFVSAAAAFLKTFEYQGVLRLLQRYRAFA